MTTLLFPGQGTQTPGFLHQLPVHPAVDETLAEASRTLGRSALDYDGRSALTSTVAVQLAALIAGVAVARALVAEGVAIDAVAGLSVGSYAAAVAAGALAFADALPLVRLRARLMEEAYPAGFGMAAFSGLSESRMAGLISALHDEAGPIYIANLNASTEIVATGAVSALERLIPLAQDAGARRTQLLAVSVPSHCPLLAAVSQRLAAALDDIPVSAPRITYVGNRRARALRDAAAVKEELATNISHTVRWHDSMTLLHELGERLFIEPPPGSVLTGLIEGAFPDAIARSAAVTPLPTLAYLAANKGRARD